MIFRDPDPIFQLVSDPDPVSDPTYIFLGCSLWRDMSFLEENFLDKKGIYIFKMSIHLRNCKIFTSFSKYFYFKYRSCSDPDPEGFYPGPDPAKSFGSDRIPIDDSQYWFQLLTSYCQNGYFSCYSGSESISYFISLQSQLARLVRIRIYSVFRIRIRITKLLKCWSLGAWDGIHGNPFEIFVSWLYTLLYTVVDFSQILDS